MHENLSKSILCPGVCTFFFKAIIIVTKMYASSRSYLDFFGYIRFSYLYGPNCARLVGMFEHVYRITNVI